MGKAILSIGAAHYILLMAVLKEVAGNIVKRQGKRIFYGNFMPLNIFKKFAMIRNDNLCKCQNLKIDILCKKVLSKNDVRNISA